MVDVEELGQLLHGQVALHAAVAVRGQVAGFDVFIVHQRCVGYDYDNNGIEWNEN